MRIIILQAVLLLGDKLQLTTENVDTNRANRWAGKKMHNRVRVFFIRLNMNADHRPRRIVFTIRNLSRRNCNNYCAPRYHYLTRRVPRTYYSNGLLSLIRLKLFVNLFDFSYRLYSCYCLVFGRFNFSPLWNMRIMRTRRRGAVYPIRNDTTVDAHDITIYSETSQ